MKIRENVPISTLTTMRLGGEARYVVEIEAPEDVNAAYDLSQEKALPVFVLGGGANTLGRDEGYEGMIFLNKLRGIEAREDGDDLILTGMGGEIWDDIVAYASERGYTGIEALSAIPGTLGAAPVQNIGAYGQELADTFVSLQAFDRETETVKEFTREECDFGYRRSIFNTSKRGQYFIMSVTLRLHKGEMVGQLYNSLQTYLDDNGITARDPQTIRQAVTAIRADKLPDPATTPSAGSFFKNVYLSRGEAEVAAAKGIPVYTNGEENKVNTGWLIEQAGLKGQLLHGIRINEKAALVLINESATKFADLAAARTEIRQAILEKFGYDLTQEPVEIV